MKDPNWESIIELVEACRHGISLAKLLEEDSGWDKRSLRRGLRELALKNKIIRLGRGKAIRYFAVNQEQSAYFPKIPLSNNDAGIRKHVILLASSELKWSFLNKYISTGNPLSIKKCVKTIFSCALETSSKNLRCGEKNTNHFSTIKRLSKEKTDAESHRILNPKINFIVLNI